MMDFKKLWVAEWSEKQQAFHVDTLEECIKNGLLNYFHPWGSDWTLLGVFENQHDAHELCELLEDKKPRSKV